MREKQHTLAGKVLIRTDFRRKNDPPDELGNRLNAAGATLLSLPLIDIRPLPFTSAHEAGTYDWLIFTSKNAVCSFFSKQQPKNIQRIAAIGPWTAAALRSFGYPPFFTGSGISAVHFAKELSSVIRTGENALLILGNLAPDTLLQALQKTNSVERVNVYQTVMPQQMDPILLQRVKKDRYDALLMSSPSAFRHLLQLLPAPAMPLRMISIGQTTTAAIREQHLEPLITSAGTGLAGLAETTIHYFSRTN
ncbi:MAG: uroporphyrinogen-III synthase [Mangrovibacterium sp.]